MVVLLALEFGDVIEIAVVERAQHRLERIMRAANVDDNSIGVERIRDEGGIDHEGRSMQRLRGPENRAPKECAIMMWSRTSTVNKAAPYE